jgi:hypothetical protein
MKIIEKIRNNTRSLTLLKHNDYFEVSLRDGVITEQYWRFGTLLEALNKMNELSEEF